MNVFYRRHLALFCTIFAAASICGCFLALNEKLIAVNIAISALTLCGICAVFLRKHIGKMIKIFLCILFAALAIVLQVVKIDYPQQKLSVYYDKTVSLSAAVREIIFDEDFASSYVVDVLTVDGIPSSTSALIEFDYNAELDVGTLIDGSFSISDVGKYTENDFYYRSKGITLYAHSPQGYAKDNAYESIAIKLSRLNQSISNEICENIDGESGRFLSALMLGNKDLLTSKTELNFRRAGLSHVLAISGMHLSVLMFFLDFLLKKLLVPKGLRGLFVTLFSLFYLSLTGFSLSTTRAFLMSAIVYISFLVQEEHDLLTSLSFSLFLIIAASPFSVYDIGMWLSFLAVLGIFVAQHFIEVFSDFLFKKRGGKNDKYASSLKSRKSAVALKKFAIYLFSAVVITVFANVFICVPAWLFFDEISLIALPANIIVSPLVTIVMYVFPFFMVCLPIPYLSGVVSSVMNSLSELTLKTVDWFSSFESVTVSLKYFFVGPIVISVAVALAVLLIIKLKHKWIIAIPPLVGAIAFFALISFDGYYYENIVQIDYVGGAESEMLLLRDGNEYSVIDVSSGGYTYAKSAHLYSVENCATEISSYVLTHYHQYHVNALKKLFNKAVIHTLYLPYPQNTDEYYILSSLISTAQGAKIDVILFDSRKDILISDNVSINLSQRELLKRSTHPIFYLKINAHNQALLYSTESLHESEALKTMLTADLADSQYIILGAHGPISKSEFVCPEADHQQNILIANNEIARYFKCSNQNLTIDVLYARILCVKEQKTD